MAGTRRRVQYAISMSVKMRRRKRSPCRSMTSATRSMSVASSPRPMMFMLPQPNDGFAWVQASAGPALVCRALEPVAHLFTTRGWSLGSRTAGDADDGWDQVSAALDVSAASLVRAHQVHGAAVLVRRAGRTDAPLAA